MDAHEIRTKTTYGANSKKGRWNSIVRSCCGALKGMVLGLEGCLIWCTCRPNKTQYRNRIDLELAESLDQTYGRSIDFQHALEEFFRVPSNDEGAHLNGSWFQHFSNIFGVSNNLHLTELFAILRDPSPQRITFFGAILNPATFPKVQIEASAAIKPVKDEAAARSSAQAHWDRLQEVQG